MRRLLVIVFASLALIAAVALVSPGEREVRVPVPRASHGAPGPGARAGAAARALVVVPDAEPARAAPDSPTASDGEAPVDAPAGDAPRPEHPFQNEHDTDAEHLYDVPERYRGER